ncbi:hypothetical protein [Loigolactobacillus backii]|uniref:Uncharacterized protein n=1 Tax=Loigolactobacillus backii TaxID=375175 RepID=A0A192H1T2_9LACO|nr:hypothetical protein [Loigolactobacillus backii]ANK60362.1 hypothetical protein AYR52_08930 [Loigolactobacillus backii]ANK62197.1 hypothetical protein AYR53_05065 [Loigolactobacillus backii]ANK65241.1 hypothetical protein AYR54_08335 [Loigolactobacillus backii]ANK67800.1 hypothetical protein AYR55_08940 [Loigolactobacillus backii]ANK70788.1 hypothetical protein AYR56_11920 [Loigolactobacillus backii]
MDTEKCLNYQKQFFIDFAQAWHDRSDLELYRKIDTTASSLRLETSEVPAYILAYDKQAQAELKAYLQRGLTKWLRTYIPFFEINSEGVVMFGDWYHRRQFGVLDVWNRQIIQTDELQQQILPELEGYEKDNDNYLQNRLDQLHEQLYQEANELHADLDRATENADSAVAQSRLNRDKAPQQNSGRLKNLLNFMDNNSGNEETADSETTTPAPNAAEIDDLKTRFTAAKQLADTHYDEQKRQLEVEVAVIRYEYQAIVNQYSSLTQFENALVHIQESYLDNLQVAPNLASEGDDQHA